MVQTMVGALGTIEFICSIVAWAVLLDFRVGAFYGVLVFAYSFIAHYILSNFLSSLSPFVIVTGSLVCLILAIVVEASCHIVFQAGILPGPISEKLIKLPEYQRPLIGIYFAIVFGLFFLSFDLSLRFLHHKPDLHKTANTITNAWHKILADEAEKKKLLAARDFHLYVIKQQSL